MEIQQKHIQDLLSYIHSKEETKKKEIQAHNIQNREKYLAIRSELCHEKEEKDITNADDAERTKRNHYKRISQEYESLWNFEEQYEPILTDDIFTLLDFKEHDVVVDLGGGTGQWSDKIKKSIPTCDVLLVEPSKDMINLGVDRDGIQCFLMNETKFLDSNIYFNKMMVKGCIHHFKDIKGFLDRVYERLPEGGRCLVLTLNDEGYCLPYPEIVKSYVRKVRSESDFMKQFYEKPWFSKIIHREYPVSVSQDHVRKCVKGRFTSTLSIFTDEQLATGLDEQFKDKDTKEMINFVYSESLLMMEKPFNIKVTQEDMNHMSEHFKALGMLDQVNVDMQMFPLKVKLENMITTTKTH